MKDLEEIWPVFGLRIVAGPLELRAIRDDDIPALVDLAEQGIHDPAGMPFLFPWSTAPVDELGRNMATFYWTSRTQVSPARWSLELVARWHGVIVGSQGITTENYLVTRTGETGSWLGREHQGHGIGTVMRQTICAFVLDHLDAEEVTSAAFVDNPASLAVSRKVGYVTDGRQRVKRRDSELAISQRLVLRPEDLVRNPYDLEVTGVGPLRAFLGLED